MTEHKIDYDIAMEIASHEAFVRQAYKDSVGVWTWSVGLTSATGHMVERYIGKPQSLDHCLRVYVWALDNYSDAVRKAFEGVALTKPQFAAACSFHWNTGAIGRATWVKKFKAGDIAGARKAFMSWDKPAEIKGRREKERDLFFDGKWSNQGRILEYDRVTSAGKIDWKSGHYIDASKALREAIDGEIPASDKVIVERQVKVPVPVEVEVPVEVPVAVAPKELDKPVQKTAGFWDRITTIALTIGAGGFAWMGDYRAVLAVGGVAIVVTVVGLVFHNRIITTVKRLKEEVNGVA